MMNVRKRRGTKQHVLPIWYGMKLRTWLKLLSLRPPIDLSYSGRIATITLASTGNSILGAAEQTLYGRRVERMQLTQSPVFLLGHWRSGTTLLHNLLSHDKRFVAPTQYQVIFPEHFLLSQRWLSRMLRRVVPEQRPMDAMKLSWAAPSEDEIALLLLTLKSPYLRTVFPNGSAVADRYDDLRRNLNSEELDLWKREFLRFLKKVSYESSETLLLKSPTHTGRIPLLLEMFPDARFIYIVRNPYEVFSSTCHLYRVLAETNRFTHQEIANLDEQVLTGYQRLYNAYHLQRALIPADRRYELRFEDLVDDPVRSLEQLYGHFGWSDFASLRTALEPELADHRSYQRNRYELDDQTRELVYERWRPAFNRYRYSP